MQLPVRLLSAEWFERLEAEARVLCRQANIQDAAFILEEIYVAAPALPEVYGSRSPGYRLEFGPSSTRRAAGEWSYALPDPQWPLALTEFYWNVHLLRFTKIRLTSNSTHLHQSSSDHLLVADVGSEGEDAGRRAWREAIRRRPKTKILIDEPGMIIAELR